MKVSSPIGDLPFEPQTLHLQRGGIRMEGVMGAWPATVQITAQDIPALARLVAKPAAAGALATLTIVSLTRIVRSSSRRS